MKQYSYIQRVLSHISGKARKKEIEYELFDHLNEKERYWEAIGYDESASTEKAETAMGDADIVGERLDSVKKYSNISYIIATLIPVLLTVAWFEFIVYYNKKYLALQVDPNLIIYAFSSISILLTTGCIVTFLGYIKKRFSLYLSGTITIESVLLLGYKFNYGIGLFFDRAKNSILDLFFQSSANNDFYWRPTKSEIIFAVIFLALFLINIIIGIKTLLLKNTKKDMMLKKASIVIMALFSIIIPVCSATALGFAVYAKDKAVEDTKASLLAADKTFIQHIEDFMTYNDKKLEENSAAYFKGVPVYHYDSMQSVSCFPQPFELEGTHNQHGKYDNINVFLLIINRDTDKYTTELEGFENETKITVDGKILNPFCSVNLKHPALTPNYYEILAQPNPKEIVKGSSIKDAPLPAIINFEYTDNVCMVIMQYDYEGNKKLTYCYDRYINDFILTDGLNNTSSVTPSSKLLDIYGKSHYRYRLDNKKLQFYHEAGNWTVAWTENEHTAKMISAYLIVKSDNKEILKEQIDIKHLTKEPFIHGGWNAYILAPEILNIDSKYNNQQIDIYIDFLDSNGIKYRVDMIGTWRNAEDEYGSADASNEIIIYDGDRQYLLEDTY